MNPVTEQIGTLTGPNEEVLEAQARVCTGPNQSRPLGEKPGDPDPDRILSIILDSLRGSLPADQAASRAQIGAFLSAMTLRKKFPPATTWSDAETSAFKHHLPDLQHSDSAIRFLVRPSTEDAPSTDGEPETRVDRELVRHLREILQGKHLSYEQTRAVLRAVMSEEGDPALKAAVLIGQRMNLEDYGEFRGYLDSVIDPDDVRGVAVDSLTTIGEPYNGSTRFFKPTCFVAAVRAALGRPTLLHGVDTAPPKSGITEEQILRSLGANTRLSVDSAARLIERKDIAFAYLAQQDFAPHAYRMLDMRVHIKKRPSWAATEKAQQILKSPERNDSVVGYFHPGYEEKQLRSMRDRGFEAGFVIKGEEGTSQLSLRSGAPSKGNHKTLNYVQGYRGSSVEFAQDLEPSDYGFHYAQSPRPAEVTAKAFAREGYEALRGIDGHIQDRIALNAGIVDWLLGYTPNPHGAISDARRAIQDGSARAHLDAYVKASHLV